MKKPNNNEEIMHGYKGFNDEIAYFLFPSSIYIGGTHYYSNQRITMIQKTESTLYSVIMYTIENVNINIILSNYIHMRTPHT